MSAESELGVIANDKGNIAENSQKYLLGQRFHSLTYIYEALCSKPNTR